MADKVVLEAEVKSNIGDVSKDAAGLASEFKVMGVSLNSVKAGFVSAGKSAKVMFGSIKAGIMSTGIGALLIAFGSLATFFTKTKKGAELLEVAFSGLGAAMSVIVDRVSKFGGAIVKLFQGDAKGALQDVKGAFTGIGEEIANDTRQAIALKQAFQDLRDSERNLNVETAQRRAEIEALKLIAEDVTNSEQVRLKAAQDAFAIENKLLADRVANAEEAVRIQKEQNEINQSMDEDLDALAQKEIDLANIKAESTTKQIELNNKINSIQAESAAKRLEELNALKEADALRMGELTEMPRLAVEVNDQLIQASNEYTDVAISNSKKRTRLTQEEVNNQLQAFSGLAGALGSLAGESKELAIGQAIIDTYVGANKAFAQGGTVGFVTGAAVIAAGLANVQKIMQQDVGSSGGGGGGIGGNMTPPQTPAPQMMSGAFELSGGVAPEPMKAFVVTDEMTNSQNQLANIRRRATI
jgi:hypothetical protein